MSRPTDRRSSGAFNSAQLGASLKLRRLSRKLTLRELSEQTGFSISSLSELEQGEKLTFQKVARVCATLGVRLSTIVLEAERVDPARRASTDSSTRL
ncbi:helix-turn-helix transcriptional regulator [Variovorax sp. LjRoot290]|uniref:helix-turn-helix domain-containing protein n=1 Tax=unclassified Variovorax TaxID=663243 RepID=UPI003ECD2700